jgi:hypothetical protein
MPIIFINAYIYNGTSYVGEQRFWGGAAVTTGNYVVNSLFTTITFTQITRAAGFPATVNDSSGFGLYIYIIIL